MLCFLSEPLEKSIIYQ